MYRILFSLLACTILAGCVSLNLTEHKRYIGGRDYKLQGGSPAGGEYSGPGVRDGILHLREAGRGKHTITYTVWGKSASDTFEITGTIIKGDGKKCPVCNGDRKCKRCKGDLNFREIRKCPDCENGKIKHSFWFPTKCKTCKGSGQLQDPCKACGGDGKCQNCR